MRFIGIDPASKTGLVALDENGQVLKAKELTGVGPKDPKRMATLIKEIGVHVRPDDIVCIEGFPYNTQRAMFAGGLHHGIRIELWMRDIKYYEVAPNLLKKFVNVTGWTGEPGSKRRLKGKEKKKAVMDEVQKHFGFVHTSDNVVDAYVLAQIAHQLVKKNRMEISDVVPEYQEEVIDKIINPPAKKKKVK